MSSCTSPIPPIPISTRRTPSGGPPDACEPEAVVAPEHVSNPCYEHAPHSAIGARRSAFGPPHSDEPHAKGRTPHAKRRTPNVERQTRKDHLSPTADRLVVSPWRRGG